MPPSPSTTSRASLRDQSINTRIGGIALSVFPPSGNSKTRRPTRVVLLIGLGLIATTSEADLDPTFGQHRVLIIESAGADIEQAVDTLARLHPNVGLVQGLPVPELRPQHVVPPRHPSLVIGSTEYLGLYMDDGATASAAAGAIQLEREKQKEMDSMRLPHPVLQEPWNSVSVVSSHAVVVGFDFAHCMVFLQYMPSDFHVQDKSKTQSLEFPGGSSTPYYGSAVDCAPEHCIIKDRGPLCSTPMVAIEMHLDDLTVFLLPQRPPSSPSRLSVTSAPDTMSATQEELSSLYTETCCAAALFTVLVYDFLLCFSQEVELIWNWRSQRVTVSSLLYALSRYTFIINYVLVLMTTYPMSNRSCTANIWIQDIMGILGLIASSTFSALRAYALSNRCLWLATIIIVLALPPVAMKTVEQAYLTPENLPSPLNCNTSSSIPPTLFVSVPIIARVSQLTAELLVIGITWWYTYQTYRIRRGVRLGKTVSSLLLYNGSMYFICLATLYILDIILGLPSLPMKVQKATALFDVFIDPITTVLTCHFILSLRQFDSTIVSATYSGLGPQLQEQVASAVLQFGAQPSDSLPAAIASFAHPVHLDAVLPEVSLHPFLESGSEDRGVDVVAPTRERHTFQGSARGQTSSFERSV